MLMRKRLTRSELALIVVALKTKKTPNLDLAAFSKAKGVPPKLKIRKTNIEARVAEIIKANFCQIVVNRCIIDQVEAHSPNMYTKSCVTYKTMEA